MVKVEILGSGCANCRQLEANAREAAEMAGVEVAISKIIDYPEIAARGVMTTPGLIIDGEVKSVGRVPSSGDIAEWLSAAG